MFCIFSIWLTKTPDKIIPNETCIIQEYLDKVWYFYFNSLFKFIIYNSILNYSWSLVVLRSGTLLNPFQPSVAFHTETSHLIFIANQMSGFYEKCITSLKWVNSYSPNVTFLYLLKTSENRRFSDVFRGYRNVTLGEWGLTWPKQVKYCSKKQ